MKEFFKTWLLFAVFLVSCSPAIKTPPTKTLVPTKIFSPTSTFTSMPTVIATKTPNPTATPQKELTAADVGLPWNPGEVNNKMKVKPCYVFTSNQFHAGDMIYFPNGNSNSKYNVIAIADGQIVNAVFLSDAIGWEINVMTPYLHDGKDVFYDVVHSAGLASGLEIGSYVHKGDNLAIKTNKTLDPQGLWQIDIGIRNGHRQANAGASDWKGLGYFSLYRLIQDDLQKLDSALYTVMPTCNGNPIKINNFVTPTPDSNFGMFP
jgi:hypothetical protein